MFDIVTVFHNSTNKAQTERLSKALDYYADEEYKFWPIDNTKNNRGFGPACNYGVTFGTHPYIGFLNPDVEIEGPFMSTVRTIFERYKEVVICGHRYGKPQRELRIWGVRNWVCGATMFVRRDWFEDVGGFDERFIWSWEETDLIRRAEQARREVRSINLPVSHHSPHTEPSKDKMFKQKHFNLGAAYYREKWRT